MKIANICRFRREGSQIGKKGGSSSGAKAQAAASEQSAREATYADRADQYNPFGSITYGQQQYSDPGTGKMVTKWTQNQNLSPELQKIYDTQMRGVQGQSGLYDKLMSRAGQEMGAAPDFDQFGDVIDMNYDPTELRQRAEDDAYGRQTSRLDPQFAQQAEALEISLRNKGLRPGDQAYEAQMAAFGRDRNDAYEQARMGSTDIGRMEAGQLWNQELQGNELANQLRQQQIQEYIDKRGYSLGEAQAVDPTQKITDLSEAFGAG